MKSNLAKKIVSITIIALVVALVITTVVLALVPKKMEDPIASGYSRMVIYKDGSSAAITKDLRSDVYNKIQELHDESLKDNLLSAIFQGTGKFDITVKKEAMASNAINSIVTTDTVAIAFEYLGEEPQVLKINGEVYKDKNTYVNTSTVTFDTIVMPLGNSDNFEECTIYLVNSSNNSCSYSVKFLACQAELNEYVSGIEFGTV